MGGHQERPVPWGSGPYATGDANAYVVWDCFYPGGNTYPYPCTGKSNIAPVGSTSLGAGRWGQMDLVGDMRNWVLDWYDIAGSPSFLVEPCVDCANLTPTTARWAMSASFRDRADLYDYGIGDSAPAMRDPDTGFRCARSP